MSYLLLTTKIYVPKPRPALAPRERLIVCLDEGLNKKLTLVSAPAGFGKTTLLSEWAKKSPISVAWVSLDEGDNDIVHFLSYVIAALQTVEATIGETTLEMLQSPSPLPNEMILGALINDVAALDDGLALVLDDYHLITSQTVHDSLAYMLDHLPPQMHLIIATRADPPLPLARLRGRGQLSELRLSDLRFRADETAMFLNEVMRLNLTRDDVTALDARTEGWITGLQMAALSMQSQENISSFIQAFTGSNRYILDYLVEEVLQQQSDIIQTFLLQTSILRRLTGPLCDAVTGQQNSRETLAEMEQRNLFLLPMDTKRQWYRYHQLFVDLLRQRLGQAQPDQIPILHRRAGKWYEQNGLIPDAIEHALSAKDFERAADMIAGEAEAKLMRSEVVTLLNWLDALPDEMIRARPAMHFFYNWALLLGGRPLGEIEAWLEDADRPAKLVSEQTAPLHAYLAALQGRIEEAVEMVNQVTANLPKDNTFVRGFMTLSLGSLYIALGDSDAGSGFLEEAVQIGQASGNAMVSVIGLCRLGRLSLRKGRLREAMGLFERAVETGSDQHGKILPIAGYALMEIGDLWREWNDLEAATRYLTRGIVISGDRGEALAITGHTSLARVRLAQGDVDGAYEALQKAKNLAIQFDSTDMDDLIVSVFRAWFWVMVGDLDSATQWAEERGLTGAVDSLDLEKDGDNAINHHMRKYEYPILARLLLAQEKSNEALGVSETILEIAEKEGRIRSVIEVEALRALAFEALGDPDQAMASLTRALTLAEPGGYVRIFIDEGPPMARLLYEATKRGIVPTYTSRLLAAFQDSAPPPTLPSEMIEPLSERELEVLELVSEGLSNQEIAQRLFLSTNTVKVHTRNIYGKLGVSNRTEASARARALGLL